MASFDFHILQQRCFICVAIAFFFAFSSNSAVVFCILYVVFHDRDVVCTNTEAFLEPRPAPLARMSDSLPILDPLYTIPLHPISISGGQGTIMRDRIARVLKRGLPARSVQGRGEFCAVPAGYNLGYVLRHQKVKKERKTGQS